MKACQAPDIPASQKLRAALRIGGVGGREMRERLRREFGQLATADRRSVALAFCGARPPPRFVANLVDIVFPESDQGHRPKNVGNSCLLTWIGPWGVKDSAQEWVIFDESVSLDDVVHECKESPAVVQMWEKAMPYIDQLRRRVGAQDVAVALEVCPETFEKKRIVRLHIHSFLRGAARLSLPPLVALAFDGAVPVLATVVGGMPIQRKSNTWSGYFYCVVEPKVGRIFSHGNRRPFKDFLVDNKWIFNLLQAEK